MRLHLLPIQSRGTRRALQYRAIPRCHFLHSCREIACLTSVDVSLWTLPNLWTECEEGIRRYSF